MRAKIPNLARKPFLNTRPVVRTAILLGVLGLLLTGVNLFAYWSFSQGQDVKRDRLEATRTTIEQERARIEELEKRQQRVDLESQNEQVAFLNRKIEQRTFGWSLLFDTLTEILPRDVRLDQLSLEEIGEEPNRRSRRRADADEPRPGEILLGIQGEARQYDAILDFLDALFESPAFRNPDPSGDTKMKNGMHRFRLQVIYLPERAAGLADQPTPEDGQDGQGGPDEDGPSEVAESPPQDLRMAHGNAGGSQP